MKRAFRTLLVAVFVATPFLASCDNSGEKLTAVETVQPQEGLIGDLLDSTLKLLGRILGGADANGAKASAWIGTGGGTISTAAYTLTVPAGAVSKPTLFVVEPTNIGLYVVDLHAYEQTLLGKIDVGAKGFLKPVTLSISYAQANGVQDPAGLVVLYVSTTSLPEIQTTIVDLAKKKISSPLSHFSKYAMAQN